MLKVYVVGLGKPNMGMGWPYHRFDIVAAMKEYREKLQRIGESKGIEFHGYDVPEKESHIIQLLDRLESGNFDAVLAISLTAEFASLGPPIFKIADSGLPTVVYTKPFSTYWDGAGRLYKGGYKVVVCDSNNIEDVTPIFDVVKAVVKLKHTRLLLLKDYDYDIKCMDPRVKEPRWMGTSYFRRLKEIFGIETVKRSIPDVFCYYEQIKETDANLLATEAINASAGIFGPTEGEITKAARLYLAVRDMMKATHTNAVTIDCLSSIRHKTLPISPCLTISRLNDEGIPAGCEADVESLITLCFCHYLADRPGFQADPVIDEGSNKIIFAHCTAATRLMGDGQPRFRYRFRTQTESFRDVAIETDMKANEEVTILKLIGVMGAKYVCWPEITAYKRFEGYHLLAYKAKTVKLAKLEWGCRTKVAIELTPDEIETFKRNFYGHHRVLLYGDYVKQLQLLARFLGINFVNKLYLEVK